MAQGAPISADTVRDLILASLPPGASAETVLFGAGGALDSLGLVNFLADLEYRIDRELGRELVLASERAMSRNRSPFRDVDALTVYVVELLND